MSFFKSIFLMGQPQGAESGTFPTWAMVLVIIVIFYFFMLKPQQKKAKEAKSFRESLKKGSKIVTIGGIHGKVEVVKEKTVIIVTEDGGKLKIEKSALSQTGSVNETAIAQK